MDWEEKILAMQESESDDCKNCEFSAENGKYCRGQCMEIQSVTNPYLEKYL